MVNLKINNHKFKVIVLSSEKKRRKGMMKKRFNESFNGMLFIEGEGNHCFWMKDCLIPLDIIFIKNKKISKIHHKCQPCNDGECEDRFCGDGDLVLEVKGGTCKKLDINEGDEISLNV